jgi:hypothetical protein
MPRTMVREDDVKAEVRKLIKAHRAWYYMHVPMGYGRDGIPDFTVCLRGVSVAIETKFSTRPLKPAQARELRDHSQAGGFSFVVNENGLLLLSQALDAIAMFSRPPFPPDMAGVYVLSFNKKGDGIVYKTLASLAG